MPPRSPQRPPLPVRPPLRPGLGLSADSEGCEATLRDLASLPRGSRTIRGALRRYVSTAGDTFRQRHSAGIFAHRQGEPGSSSVRRRRGRGCGRGRLTLRLVADTLAGADLAVDLGLLSPPPGFIATGRSLLAVERGSRSPSRLVAQPYGGAGTTQRVEPLLALVRKALALIRTALTFVGKPLAFIRQPFALHSEQVALIGHPISFVCTTFFPGRLSPRLIDADDVRPHRPLIVVGGLQTTKPPVLTFPGNVLHDSSMNPRKRGSTLVVITGIVEAV
jgi:hypothetical protein